MPVWVSLLRGVNLGARNKVSMPALRDALVDAGFSDVRTYVQSGNVVTSSRHRSSERVAAAVRGVVAHRFGLDVPVAVRSPAQLRAVLAWNPFPDAAAERPTIVHVVHLFDLPAAEAVRALLAETEPLPERVAVRGREVVVDYGTGMRGATVQGTWLRRRLGGVDGTARSWRTLTALCALTARA